MKIASTAVILMLSCCLLFISCRKEPVKSYPFSKTSSTITWDMRLGPWKQKKTGGTLTSCYYTGIGPQIYVDAYDNEKDFLMLSIRDTSVGIHQVEPFKWKTCIILAFGPSIRENEMYLADSGTIEITNVSSGQIDGIFYARWNKGVSYVNGSFSLKP